MRCGKIVVYAAVLMVSTSLSAYAQLSSNPWVQSNDEEDIAEVYEKRQRRGRGKSMQYYETEDTVVIDRTHAYIQEDEEQEETGFLDKMKNMVSPSKKEEAPLIPNTKDNRRKLAAQKQAQAQAEATETKENDSLIPSFGIAKNISSLKNSLKLPSVNATGMIQKFERASGINLKSIGRQMKGK